MLYFKNINDLSLLHAELEKLKALYAQALHKKEDSSTLQQLRKTIKLVVSRIDLIEAKQMITAKQV